MNAHKSETDRQREAIIAAAAREGAKLAPPDDLYLNLVDVRSSRFHSPSKGHEVLSEEGHRDPWDAARELIDHEVHRHSTTRYRRSAHEETLTYAGTVLIRTDGTCLLLDLQRLAQDIEDENEADAEADYRHNQSLRAGAY